MPKDNRRLITTRLLTPKELAERQLLISEIQQMVITTHMPMADAFGLFITGGLIYRVLAGFRFLFSSDPINAISRTYCSRSYNNTQVISVDELLNQIRPLNDRKIPLESWSTYMTGVPRYYFETLMDFYRVCKKYNEIPTEALKNKLRKAVMNTHEVQENLFIKYAIPTPMQWQHECDVSIKLYDKFQTLSDLSVAGKDLLEKQRSYYQWRLIGQEELEEYTTRVNFEIEETLTYIATLFTDFFNRTRLRELMQLCVTIQTGILVNLGGWLLTKILLRAIILKFPLGAYPLFFKSCRNGAFLLTNTTAPLRADEYDLHIKQLAAIKRDITPWHNLLIFLMRAFLFISWITIVVGYISENKKYHDTGVYMGFLQPLLLAYSLHGLFPFLQERYQHYRRDHLLHTQLNHLNDLSGNFSLPKWKLIVKPKINSSYFLLEWSSNTQDTNNKIILNSILECFLKNNIKVFYHSNKQLILLEGVSFNGLMISQLTNEIKAAVQQFNAQLLLYNELKIVSRQLNIPLYRIESKIDQQKQHNYCFRVPTDLANKPSIDLFLALLKVQYGECNVKHEILNNHQFVTVVASKPSGDTNILMEFAAVEFNKTTKSTTHAPALAFSTIPQNTTEPSQPKFLKRKNQPETTSDKPTGAHSQPHQGIIKFGTYGDYDPSKPNSRIKEISAAYWPAKTHFMIFAAPKEAFPTDEQYSKFRSIRPKVVSGKGRKGIVSSGGKVFSRKGNFFCSHLKLKDPLEDTRVYDHVETFGSVHLHVFDHVVSKSH